MIRIGPAGWSYKDWAGIVYPAPKPKGFDALRYIASFFDTVEINTTFYHPATRKTADAWLQRVQDRADFRFTAKLWRRFTHERGTAWTRDEVRQVREALDPLHDAGRLGALLLQFPWSFRRTEANREWLDDLESTFRAFPLVVEVRHESWNDPATFETLRERGVGFVNIDQPLFDHSIAPSAHATSRVGYIRVHGRNYHDWFRDKAESHERYDYLYPARELEPWAERTRDIASQPGTEEVYVLTNNHYRGKGIANALMLESMIEQRTVEGPAPLFDEYATELEPFAVPR